MTCLASWLQHLFGKESTQTCFHSEAGDPGTSRAVLLEVSAEMGLFSGTFRGFLYMGKSPCQAGAAHIDPPLVPFKDLFYKEPSVPERTPVGFHVALKPGMLLRG